MSNLFSVKGIENSFDPVTLNSNTVFWCPVVKGSLFRFTYRATLTKS